ncbi:MAG: zinc-dependent alcohol dehydrogenase family protein [Thermoleophilia bacterium]
MNPVDEGVPRTMRAMQLLASGPVSEMPLRLVELPVPAPGEGEVVLRVLACGVCRTDLHIVEGDLPLHRCPIVPGHQVVAEVAGFGRGADEILPGGDVSSVPLKLGERVGVPWLHRTDGTCRYCRRGDENLCTQAAFTGWDVDGGFAEYMVAPVAFVYRLPDAMGPLDAAPLLCAGVIGYRCLRLVGVVGQADLPGAHASTFHDPGSFVDGPPRGVASAGAPRLAIYGFGSAASLCTQVAHWRGWDVYGIARDEAHRAMARELGAVWAGESDEDPGVVYDAAIVFAPVGDLALAALRRLDKGGILALGGIYSTPIPAIEYPWIYHERVLRSVANSTRRDARELLRDAALIPIRSRVQEYDLVEANQALLDLKEDRVRGSAVLRVSAMSGSVS